MHSERSPRRFKDIMRVAAGTVVGGLAIAYGSGSDRNYDTQHHQVIIEALPTAVAEFVDTREVTHFNYTQFLSTDTNTEFIEVKSVFNRDVDYLRESYDDGHQGINLIMVDKQDPNKATLIDSQEKLLSQVMPTEVNVDKKVQAILFALFDNIVEANQPAETVGIAVLRTTMLTMPKFGCFVQDENGEVIIPTREVVVVIDFYQKSVGYESVRTVVNSIPDFDSTNRRICIE